MQVPNPLPEMHLSDHQMVLLGPEQCRVTRRPCYHSDGRAPPPECLVLKVWGWRWRTCICNKFPGNDDVARVPCSEKQDSGNRKIPFLRKIVHYISLSIPVALN